MRQPQTIPGLGAILRLAAPEGAALKIFGFSSELVRDVLLFFSEIELAGHQESTLVVLLELADQKRV
jgi:hypothetical protein